MDSTQLMFSLRIVSVDSYMSEPVPGLDLCRSEFRKSEIKSVPVVRVFGSTPAGQTACLHVHGAFPYLMVPYCGPGVVDAHWSEIENYMRLLATELDLALNSVNGKSKSSRQHVFKIVLLRGIPFYGYHAEEELFLKIYFYLPGDIKRAAELLQSGMVLDRSLQPHEAHIPYVLQLFLDYNLYGMNLLHARNCWFRLPIGKPDAITELPKIKRPDDVPLEGEGNQGPVAPTERTDAKIEVPTMSQFRNFNWNLLRDKSKSVYSQASEPDNKDGEDANLIVTSSKASSNEKSKDPICTQSLSCSDLCKSVLSRTLTPDVSSASPESIVLHLCPLHTVWTSSVLPASAKLPTDVPRHSTCDIEVDVLAADISNRDELSRPSTSNPGIEAIWEDERARRRERDEDSQIAMDQSQPRVIPQNLSEREAHFIQMLYDSLDHYKEDNSMKSFSDSLSFTASSSSRKMSSESLLTRRESKDLFVSSGDAASTKDDVSSTGGSTIVLSQGVRSSGSETVKERLSQKSDVSLNEDGFSTLELLRRMEDRNDLEASVASQHGNGPFDDDHQEPCPEECARTQSRLMRELSNSFSSSPNIENIESSLDATQPISQPDDDEDVIENFEMSQRWDSAIQDLLKDLDATEQPDSDEESISIPQLDGASDDMPEDAVLSPGQKLGVAERNSTASVKQKTVNLIGAKFNCNKAVGDSGTTNTKGSSDGSSSSVKATVSETGNVQNEHSSTVFGCALAACPDAGCPKGSSSDNDYAVTSKLPCTEKQSLKPIDLEKNTLSHDTRFSIKDDLPDKITSFETLQNNTPSVKSVTKLKAKGVGSKDSRPSCSVSDVSDVPKPRNDDSASGHVHSKMQNPSDTVLKGETCEEKDGHLSGDIIDGNNSCLKQSGQSTTVDKKTPKAPDVLVKRSSDKSDKFFSQITDENPGVVLYGKTKPPEYTHSAVIDLNCMPPDYKQSPISNLDQNLIKITSTPVSQVHLNEQLTFKNETSRNSRKARSSVKKSEETLLREKNKPTRTRKPRLASKNSYLEDPLFETVFNSDFDSDVDDLPAGATKTSCSSKSSASKKTKSKKSKDTKKKKKQKVVTKWIIVNRFKGIASMRIGLWRIPKVKSVKLTSELIRLYELYSPRTVNIKTVPVSPPFIHPPIKPRPMGRRSKHMLASACPFGPTPSALQLSPKKLGGCTSKVPMPSTGILSTSTAGLNDTSSESVGKNCSSVSTTLSQSKDGNIAASPDKRSEVPESGSSDVHHKSSPEVNGSQSAKHAESSATVLSNSNSKGNATNQSVIVAAIKFDHEIEKKEMKNELPNSHEKSLPMSVAKNSKDNSTKEDDSPILEKMAQNLLCEEKTTPIYPLDDPQHPSKFKGDIESKTVKSVKPSEQGLVENFHGALPRCQRLSDLCTHTNKFNTKISSEIVADSMSCLEKMSKPQSGEEKEHSVASKSKSHHCQGSDRPDALKKKSGKGDVITKIKRKTKYVDVKGVTPMATDDFKPLELPNKPHHIANQQPVCDISTNGKPKSETHTTEQPSAGSKVAPMKIKEIVLDLGDADMTSEPLILVDESKEKVTERETFTENMVTENFAKMDGLVVSSTVSSENLITEVNAKAVWMSCVSKCKPSMPVSDKAKEVAKMSLTSIAKPQKHISSKKIDPEKIAKKKNMKAKKEAKKRKLIIKAGRSSPSPLDSDRETKITKSIVPVTSRTVEPLCNRVSPVPDSESNCGPVEEQKETISDNKVDSVDTVVSVKKGSAKKSKPVERSGKTTKSSFHPKCNQTVNASSQKKPVVLAGQAPTRKIYSPSKKVTRNSVTVKLNSISSPRTMFTPLSDDSCDTFPPRNALMTMAYMSPLADQLKSPPDPPRPWSPMLSQISNPPVQEDVEDDDILGELAESLGADATKMFRFVDDSLFKNMGCIEQLIAEHHDSDQHKETADKMESNAKDESEKMLKHFNQIFEDVTSNGASQSTSAAAGQPADHFDEFEEETLLQFIDEMTSPTQSSNVTPQPTQVPSFPLPSQAIRDEKVGTKIDVTSHLSSPVMEECVLPQTLPALKSQDDLLLPHRPNSVQPQSSKQGYFQPNKKQQQSSIVENWQPENLQRPQSCFPGQSLPNITQVQRPATAVHNWSGTDQSKHSVFNNPQMMEIHKNISASSSFAYNSQNTCFDPHKNKPDCSYFSGDPRCASQPAPHQMSSYPYSYNVNNLNQYYREPGQIPRPASVMEPPLQVFHTHVHHHHHVHSINNSDASNQQPAVNENFNSSKNSLKQQVYKKQVSHIKGEVSLNKIKTETVPSQSWPKPGTSAKEQTVKSKEKSKSKKTQCYVPNSPFPYSKSVSVTQLQIAPQGLVQTLTYVDTAVSQNPMVGKSDFYAFSGLNPQSQGIVQSSVLVSAPGPSQEAISVLLKGSCRQWQGREVVESRIMTASVSRMKQKGQKSKTQKRKLKLNDETRVATLQSIGGDQGVSPAKTPYGIMKQNSLNNLKKRQEFPAKAVERKRKTISDFRAPPDTPTISLSGWSSEGKNDSETFELSQDMFNASSDAVTACTSDSVELASRLSRSEKLQNTSDNSSNEKLNTSKSQTVAKSGKLLLSKREILLQSVGRLGRDLNQRPTPKMGEELILNSATGEWEVVPLDSHKDDGIGDVNKIRFSLAGKLPTLPDLADKFRKRSHDKLTESSSDENFGAIKKKKSLKTASGTPEYMVSSVDFESSSPRLKLTLKKTPPVRGKPQISSLVTVGKVEGIIPAHGVADSKSECTADALNEPEISDSSDDFTSNTLKKKKKILQSNLISENEDSDAQIYDVSDSTDDASENGDSDRTKRNCVNLSTHIESLTNMFILKGRVPSNSVLVTLGDEQVRHALSALAKKSSLASKHKKTTRTKSSSSYIRRAKDGKFISAKPSQNIPESCQLAVSNKHQGRIEAKLAPMDIIPGHDSMKNVSQNESILPINEDFVIVRQLLQNCCEQVSESVERTIPCSEENLVDNSNKNADCCDKSKIISCAGKGQNDQKTAISCNKNAQNTKSDNQTSARSDDNNKVTNDGTQECNEPPSPRDNQISKDPYSHFDQIKHVYTTLEKPPSRLQVTSDLNASGHAGDTSEEPFYGDRTDAKATSNRLSNLPPYVKKPKPKKLLNELSEYSSSLPLEGGIRHWTVMATAQQCYDEIELSVLRQQAATILPENVHVWDHIDAATKLAQYPEMSKIFLSKRKNITLRPAVSPPSYTTVQKWLIDKRRSKAFSKTGNSHKQLPAEQNRNPNSVVKKQLDVESINTAYSNQHPEASAGAVASQEIIKQKGVAAACNPGSTPRSSLPRSMPLPSCTPNHSRFSHPRRVSFDVPTTLAEERDREMEVLSAAASKTDSTKRFSTNWNNLSKLGNQESDMVDLKSSQRETSLSDSPKLPFADIFSPVTHSRDTMTPIHFDSTQNTVTTDGSSAIKTLIGSSGDHDDTSPLTLLISGTFSPSDDSKHEMSREENKISSIQKQLQSTPYVVRKPKNKRSLKFTTSETDAMAVEGENSQKLMPVSPIQPKPSETTPSTKKTNLRKVVLAKKFSNPENQTNSTKKDNSPGQSPSTSLATPTPGLKKEGSQIDGPTLDNTFGFKAAQQHLGDAKSLHVVQHITMVAIELHVKTRIDLRPDPDMDEIRCLFYCLDCDSWSEAKQRMRTGVIVVDPASAPKADLNTGSSDQPCTSTATTSNAGYKDRELFKKSGVTNLDVIYVNSEMDLFLTFAQLMHHWDPDILVGYEVQMLSWGYLLERAAHLRCDLCRAISRVPTDDQRNRHDAARDAYGADNASELHVVGRIVLNLWRLMRTELALYDYSFESVAYHLLHERYPSYSHHTLTNWYDPPGRSGMQSHVQRWRVIDFYVSRVRGNMKLLMQQDFIGRTSELARLFGIQFYEVLTRGSQFRVESMLLRTARAHNLVAVTPSILQRAQMRAPEVIALVMEPESKFYHVPVLVLDFQSLYPSMVIAYNICYSTCLGRVELLGSDAIFTFGCTSLHVPARTLNKLLRKNLITINPSGVAFVKSTVKKGVMPQMLDEILTTRIMVKNSMKKLGPEDAATKRMLDHRQLGLKLIANVTYGYTAANFSGRMPCVEIGDSIVHKARETLERAIRLVTQNSSDWENARVVYGDTDSMFIALEGVNNAGCSKDRAFEVGKEIAAAVTADNPTPVKLKFEKVYLPCILQTKKRYVGYAFESEDQAEPTFDAKGIETVRRDGTPATAKILEKTLKILFDTRDVSKVKEYVLKQCSKIMDGRTTFQDCIIAKEYRGKQYYRPGAVVPALNIAKKLLAMDRRAEPRVGERVPYVVVHGAPGTPLYQLVRSPLEVLKDPTLQLNGAYYVTKQVLPALDRMLSLLGVDVFLWHKHLPRTIQISYNAAMDNSQDMTSKKATISQFFKSKHCLVCKKLSIEAICESCQSSEESKQKSAVCLAVEANSIERRKYHIEQVCMQCTGAAAASEIRCVSLDCPILYKYFRAIDHSSKAKSIRKALTDDHLL